MLFNSVPFLVFLAVFLAGWRFARHRAGARWTYLTLASFFFYGWWDARFLILIIASGLIDFFAALGMQRWPARRRLLLILSIIGNVGMLGTFKFLGFLLENLNALLGFSGAGFQFDNPGLTLPVGISFYTFQSMSYTIDCARGRLKPTRNVFHFFSYISMFPQLVAGPIVRASDLLPQLERRPKSTPEQQVDGLWLIAIGYFKKVVLADQLAPCVDKAFETYGSASSGLFWWVIMIMFAFQIYCDFSGYTDIARGVAKWMGYEFPLNFDHPYHSASFGEFWRRWHISLSSWFRDYVYFPLGGSRSAPVRAHVNLWITMLVSGLWHGAAWTFVLWGAAHALLLSIERRTTGMLKPLKKRALFKPLAIVVVFLITTLTWVPFRAPDISQAWHVVCAMLTPGGWSLDALRGRIRYTEALALAIAVAWEVGVYLNLRRSMMPRRLIAKIAPLALAILIWASIFLRGPGQAFVYFQF